MHIQADYANSKMVAADATQTKTIAATTYSDAVESSHSQNSSRSPVRPESQRELAQLMIQAKNLKSNHQLVSQQLDEARRRLDQNGLQRGQMIQQYLQLDRDIKQKERDIAADESRVESLQLSQDKVRDEIDELLVHIQLVA